MVLVVLSSMTAKAQQFEDKQLYSHESTGTEPLKLYSDNKVTTKKIIIH